MFHARPVIGLDSRCSASVRAAVETDDELEVRAADRPDVAAALVRDERVAGGGDERRAIVGARRSQPRAGTRGQAIADRQVTDEFILRDGCGKISVDSAVPPRRHCEAPWSSSPPDRSSLFAVLALFCIGASAASADDEQRGRTARANRAATARADGIWRSPAASSRPV